MEMVALPCPFTWAVKCGGDGCGLLPKMRQSLRRDHVVCHYTVKKRMLRVVTL